MDESQNWLASHDGNIRRAAVVKEVLFPPIALARVALRLCARQIFKTAIPYDDRAVIVTVIRSVP